MLKLRSKATGSGGDGRLEAAVWEIRPGGMLVQKRNSDQTRSSIPISTIRVRVKSGSSCHEISISSQASFGDLKKMLAGPTGLHPQDQKLIYKEKERDSRAFLDVAGVKDGSKLVLVEDVMSRERRCLELRKTSNMGKASQAVSEIAAEVDKLAKQVATLESDILGGRKVVEKMILNLIELLMTQLIKLDGVEADGDVKLQRRVQVRRVQKYIETLDMLKIRNSMICINWAKVSLQTPEKHSARQKPTPVKKQQEHRCSRGQSLGPVVVTRRWETFDSNAA